MAKHLTICQSYSQQQMVAAVHECSQLENPEPVVFKGAIKDWPAVKRAKYSAQRFCDYILEFDAKVPVYAYECDARHKGRLFYDATHTGKNFQQKKTYIYDIINHLLRTNIAQKNTVYMGSTTLDYCLPNFRGDNDLPIVDLQPLVSLWLGSESEVAAHYDVPHNIACVVAGKRAFTLFAPEQITNLYPGPVDFTPAGQIVSMVDVSNPDHKRFPKYRHALENAYYVELESGDAIYIPSMCGIMSKVPVK